MFYFTWKKGFYISYLFSRWFLVFSKLFLLKTLLWFGPFASTRPSLTPLFPSCHSGLPSLPLQQTTCPPVSHLPSTCQSPTAGPIPATPYKAPFATPGAQGWSCSGAFQGGEKRAERQFRNLIERSFWGLKLQQFRNPWAEAAARVAGQKKFAGQSETFRTAVPKPYMEDIEKGGFVAEAATVSQSFAQRAEAAAGRFKVGKNVVPNGSVETV